MGTVASLDTLARRVSWVIAVVVVTVKTLAAGALIGALGLLLAIGLLGDWSGDAVVFAVVLAAGAAAVPFMLTRFAWDLAPARDLPTLSPADLRQAAVTLGTGLRDGERSFLQAKGLGRVTRLGRALWDLRKDVEVLNEAGLAPAAALVRTMIPSRLIRVGIAALVAPPLFVVGLVTLAVAAVLT